MFNEDTEASKLLKLPGVDELMTIYPFLAPKCRHIILPNFNVFMLIFYNGWQGCNDCRHAPAMSANFKKVGYAAGTLALIRKFDQISTCNSLI